MMTCLMLGTFFMVLLSITEWELFQLLFEPNGNDTVYSEAMYKFVQMLVWGFAFYIFTVQGLILKRAKKRLARIQMLIVVNYPMSDEKKLRDADSDTES
ncbi:hypothetical protein [Lelliottia nimipressuralis]